MNAAIRFWVHYDLVNACAHVLRIDTATNTANPDVRGWRYDAIVEAEDFLSYALDETHSDASGYIMAAEMRAKADLWLEIDADRFEAIEALGAITFIPPFAFAGGAEREGDRLFARTGGPRLNITEQCSG